MVFVFPAAQLLPAPVIGGITENKHRDDDLVSNLKDTGVMTRNFTSDGKYFP